METQNYDWLDELQAAVGEWSEENFGDQPPSYPMIGAGEEIGELTTSVLKREQGIDDSDKYDGIVGDEEERDAVGDVTIYLLDMLSRFDTDGLSDNIDSTLDNLEFTLEGPIDAIRVLYCEYGFLLSTSPDDMIDLQVKNDVAAVIIVLEEFCELRGFDYKSCVVEAWEEVSGREWDANVA